MQGRERRSLEGIEQGELQQISVKMNNIKLVGNPPNAIEHYNVMRNGIQNGRIKPQGPVAAFYQPRRAVRIPTCEKRDLMTATDKLLGKIRHDPLGTTIEFWGNTFC